MEMKEIYRLARERFNGACRVCPICNGRACAGEMPGMGGIGTGSSFMANFDSLSRIKLNLRTAMLYTGCRSLAEISPCVLLLEMR